MGYNYTKKLIFFKIELQKNDMGEVYTQKVHGNFKKRTPVF